MASEKMRQGGGWEKSSTESSAEEVEKRRKAKILFSVDSCSYHRQQNCSKATPFAKRLISISLTNLK